jgi:hypothetical protein
VKARYPLEELEILGVTLIILEEFEFTIGERRDISLGLEFFLYHLEPSDGHLDIGFHVQMVGSKDSEENH